MAEGSAFAAETFGQAPNELEGLWVVGEARVVVRRQACRTVVWLRPPKRAPMAGRVSVGVLAREVHGDLAWPGERAPRGCARATRHG